MGQTEYVNYVSLITGTPLWILSISSQACYDQCKKAISWVLYFCHLARLSTAPAICFFSIFSTSYIWKFYVVSFSVHCIYIHLPYSLSIR